MGIVRAEFRRAIDERREPHRLHMNHPIPILQNTLGQENLAPHYDQPLTFLEIGCHDYVCNAGFIVHREEDEICCRTGPLAGTTTSNMGFCEAVTIYIVFSISN
jgi:hypothetical protein